MRRLLYLVVVLLAASCIYVRPEQMSCDETRVLQEQIGRNIPVESFRTWISEKYQLARESVTAEAFEYGGAHYYVSWQKGRIAYTAWLSATSIEEVSIDGEFASLDRIMACLGKPAQYRASYTDDIPGTHLNLNLFFSDQGAFAYGYEFYRSRPKLPPSINGDFPIASIMFMKPRSTEEIVFRIFGGGNRSGAADIHEQVLKEVKPWPEKWTDIVVTVPR